MVLGVAEPALGYPVASSVSEAGVERALVVCGAEKLDEISCAGPTHVWEVKQGRIIEETLDPSDFELPSYPLTAVGGGNPRENAEIFKILLTSGDRLPENLVPTMDWVAMNASALLVVAGVARGFPEGVRLAKESITSGRAWEAFEIFRESSQQAASVRLGLQTIRLSDSMFS
jgi:anthranilate phosphoribosyltransferase